MVAFEITKSDRQASKEYFLDSCGDLVCRLTDEVPPVILSKQAFGFSQSNKTPFEKRTGLTPLRIGDRVTFEVMA
jgi:hypothetical protein